MLPRKFLVIKLRALGDTVVLTVSLAELKKQFPEALIDVVVPREWSEILENFPSLHKIWFFQRKLKLFSKITQIIKLGFKLRKEKYDCVIHLHASPSSAILARLSGAPLRSIHFHGHTDKNHYSTVLIPGKGQVKSTIERDLDALRALGLKVTSASEPKIYLLDWELKQAQERFQEYKANFPILGLHLGASRETKRWPIENFTSLALTWRQKTQGSVFIISDPIDQKQMAIFPLNFTEKLKQLELPKEKEELLKKGILIPDSHVTLRGLAGILSQISVLVAGDSGPRHLAVAVGTPTVTLFGPENPLEWHPYSANKHPYFFIAPLPCRKEGVPHAPAWCALKVCTEEGHRCMVNIHVEEVFEKAQSVAKNFTPGALHAASPCISCHHYL